MSRGLVHWYDWYWLSWLVGVFASFGSVEGYAIYSHKTYMTLSWTIWGWTDNDPGQAWNIGHYAWPHWLLIAFMVWLTLHLCWRIPPHWLIVFTVAGMLFYLYSKVGP